MQIAVVGAGPAGCRVSELLALKGHQVTLFDPQGPWEKPCGGGITSKRLNLGRFLPPEVPRQNIDRVSLHFGDRVHATLPTDGLVVVSRRDLALHSHAAALRAGVKIVEDRVTQLDPREAGWTLATRAGSLEVDYVVGADGATSFVRRTLGTPLTARDLHVTVGYFIPGQTDFRMKIFFLPRLEGYVWSFPRPDHLSYGLITSAEPNWTSRSKQILSNYIEADLGREAMERAVFYSAPVPALSPAAWAENQIHGKRWALIGDAAGLVDPITGEGIHYAFRSATILAESLPNLSAYADAIKTECGTELMRAAQLYSLFYTGRFVGASFRQRMVEFARRSARVRAILADLIDGSQSYVGLRRRLLWSAPRIAFELARRPSEGEGHAERGRSRS